MRNVSANTRKLTTLAMLAALAIVLVALIHFPLVPAAPFLEYDPADIPIFIGTGRIVRARPRCWALPRARWP